MKFGGQIRARLLQWLSTDTDVLSGQLRGGTRMARTAPGQGCESTHSISCPDTDYMGFLLINDIERVFLIGNFSQVTVFCLPTNSQLKLL